MSHAYQKLVLKVFQSICKPTEALILEFERSFQSPKSASKCGSLVMDAIGGS